LGIPVAWCGGAAL